VSKATKRHCTGTVHSQGGRVGNVKQVGFEARPEDSYGRCGSDMIRQTVPDASSGDRKSSACGVIGSLYALQFLIYRTLVLVLQVTATKG